MNQLVPVKLVHWQDPQGDVVLHAGRDLIDVYFNHWIESGVPAETLVKLRFNGAWASRTFCSEFLPYQHSDSEVDGCSWIYRVQDSEWMASCVAERKSRYDNWTGWESKEYNHFVVQGHDNYVDILAESFEEVLVDPADVCGVKSLKSDL